MKIAIFGGTGRVGREVLSKAMADGHQVRVLVRDIQRLETLLEASFAGMKRRDTLQVYEGDARSDQSVRAAIAGADAVFSALGTDGGTVLSETMPHILSAMSESRGRRLVTIGTAGILRSRAEPDRLRYESSESRRTQTRAALEHRRVWEMLELSDANWTIVCPTYLPDGERTGQIRVEREYLPAGGREISVPDTADFAYKQLWDLSFTRCRVGICY
ncbi:NAD(P)-dependent oxidoreductase [Paenibacillus sp. 1P07SE]|uniref:NAD(P)-dependent oxidoreductase n=1 Tax=Paenibacillus sp. 1P07SE TaxID=3132209 RepID=UPI0039A77F25